MKMKSLGTVALVAILATGCKDAELTADDLVGTWNAVSINFSLQPDLTPTIELVALGFGMQFTAAANGDYTLIETYPAALQLGPDTVTATFEVLPGNIIQLAASGTGSPTNFDAELLGTVLTITNDSDSFDFDDDGTDENAQLRITFNKQ